MPLAGEHLLRFSGCSFFFGKGVMEMIRDSPRKLPEFKGYTVDFRLREFRRVVYGKSIEFIPFESRKGRKLLRKMERSEHGKRILS